MSRRQDRLEEILTIVRNIKKKAIVSRKKTGWFDKETLLNRITTAISRVYALGVSEREKQEALAKCWKVYLDVQGMSGADGIRDQHKIPLKQILRHFRGADVPEEEKVDSPSPLLYSGGLGYAHVNWNYVYVDPNATSNVWGDQYWQPHRRYFGNELGSLEDSDYWVFRDARKERDRSKE